MPYLRNLLKESARLDVVNDVYLDDSLKSHVRGLRGSGVRINKVKNDTKLPTNWNTFLRSDSNIMLLVEYLSEEVVSQMKDEGKAIGFTTGERVRSASNQFSYDTLQPCNQEEADTRMFLHISDAVNTGHTTFLIRTNDTDVVVLAVSYAAKKHIAIYLSFGTGGSHRFLDATDIGTKLGAEKCRALLLFHSYSGCDTTSFFKFKGKKRFWAAWDSFQELTPVLIKLTESMLEPSESDLKILERYVALVYDKSTELSEINKVRQHLFASSLRAVDHIPPTQAALKYHLKRSLLQARTWFKMDCKHIKTLDPADYGWNKDKDNIWKPTWTDLPPIGKSRVFIKCLCKDCDNTRGRGCGCRNENLPCYIGCACKGMC